MVRIHGDSKYDGKEGEIIRVQESLSGSTTFAESEEQLYVVKVDKKEETFPAKKLIYIVGAFLPPLRWGAKFGKRSMIFLSREGMQLPKHGWSISGAWIKRLSSSSRFLTLCESSNGDKIIGLDHEMRLGSFETATDHNDGNTWHCSNFKLNNIDNVETRKALGLSQFNSLSTEERWMHLVVSASPGRHSSSKGQHPSMIYYLNGYVVDTVSFTIVTLLCSVI
jgi:hypothetical protein